MPRQLLILANESVRERAVDWIAKAPVGTRIEFKGPKRSLEQNAKLWATLTDIASQATHSGRKYTTDQWKAIFLNAIGREIQFIPALDGQSFIPWGQSSSDLSKDEMSELLAFMEAWCAENGVTLHYIEKAA